MRRRRRRAEPARLARLGREDAPAFRPDGDPAGRLRSKSAAPPIRAGRGRRSPARCSGRYGPSQRGDEPREGPGPLSAISSSSRPKTWDKIQRGQTVGARPHRWRRAGRALRNEDDRERPVVDDALCARIHPQPVHHEVIGLVPALLMEKTRVESRLNELLVPAVDESSTTACLRPPGPVWLGLMLELGRIWLLTSTTPFVLATTLHVIDP